MFWQQLSLELTCPYGWCSKRVAAVTRARCTNTASASKRRGWRRLTSWSNCCTCRRWCSASCPPTHARGCGAYPRRDWRRRRRACAGPATWPSSATRWPNAATRATHACSTRCTSPERRRSQRREGCDRERQQQHKHHHDNQRHRPATTRPRRANRAFRNVASNRDVSAFGTRRKRTSRRLRDGLRYAREVDPRERFRRQVLGLRARHGLFPVQRSDEVRLVQGQRVLPLAAHIRRPHRVPRPEKLEDIGAANQLHDAVVPQLARAHADHITQVLIAEGVGIAGELVDDGRVLARIGGEDLSIWAAGLRHELALGIGFGLW